MNIIKRIGVALSVVLLDSVTKKQAKELIESYRAEFGVTIDNHQFNEMQRRCDRLSYLEGVGYTLHVTDPKVALPPSFKSTQATFNPALAAPNGQQATQALCAPPKQPKHIERNNRRGSVQDFVLHCINGLPNRYYTSIDVWREYQLFNGPKTTRGTVLACVTYLRESGVIQAANPPRKLGSKIVHQK
jgi:hypothetical protein